MFNIVAFDYAIFRQVKHGKEQFWWQDRELFIFSYWQGDRLWRHYLVHHPMTGVQIGYVRWWYGNQLEDTGMYLEALNEG